MQLLPYVKRTSRQQAHLACKEGTSRINWNGTRHRRHGLAKVVGGAMRRQRREGGFEHRTSGERHEKGFRQTG
jgi:hypothetical protein